MVTRLYRLDHEGWWFLALHSSATSDMKRQAFVNVENVKLRVMPFLDSLSCHAGKRLERRSGRWLGWSAAKIMSFATGVRLGCAAMFDME